MSWLDFRIGSTLAGPHSNQLIWALWLLVSVLLALWLAIAPGTTWLFAVCAAVLRSFEKTAVMAYCWSKYGYSGLWTQIFLPEIYVFLFTFWLGQRLSHISHAKGIDESRHSFDSRVRRISALTAAIAAVLTFLGAVLVAVITGMTAHR
jgi:H+/Cl- antiporter ClcA